MRIKLTVAYDGTDFKGWAANAGHRTVQRTLTEAVRRISGEENEIVGASRTDSGAHAKAAVCHFDTHRPIPVENWPRALNQVLPKDLAVIRSQQMPDDFNSRFWALDRHYRYRILVGARDPHRERFAYFHGRPVDLEAMQDAASRLKGTHDFSAYTEEVDLNVTNTVRTLFDFQVRQVRDEVWVDVVGTAFLRGMMRRMAGVVLEVGRGYRPVVEVSRLLDSQERNQLQWPVVLPARGLCLMRVRYGRHPKDFRKDGFEAYADQTAD